MRKWFVLGCCASIVVCVSGCGPAYARNPILEKLPAVDKKQIDSVLKHTTFDVHLPTTIPFEPLHGRASATTPTSSGRSLSQTVSISFNNQTELLKLVEPSDAEYTGHPVALKGGITAYYQVTSRYSTLSWQGTDASFTLYSSTIENGDVNAPLKPDFTEQELVDVASSTET
jgi:hypothetical protein